MSENIKYEKNQLVRYTGESDDDMPFSQGDIIRLVEPDGEGWMVVAKAASEGDKAEGVQVFPDEIEEEGVPKKTLKVKRKVLTQQAPAKKITAKEANQKEKAGAAKIELPSLELVLTKEVNVALEGKTAVNAARALVKQAHIDNYTLGGVLAKILRDGDYEDVKDEDGNYFKGKEGFSRFIELDLGMKYRKAMYLIQYYNTFAPLGIDAQKLAAIGYVKAKEVFDVVQKDPDSAEQWLEDASTLKMDALVAKVTKARKKLGIVRTPRGTTGSASGDAGMTTFKFTVFNNQGTIIEDAIEQAKAQIEATEDDSDEVKTQKAIVLIFSEWSQLQGD